MKLFASEYVIDFDHLRAARAVGVNKEYASATGLRWLADPEVIAEIARLLKLGIEANDSAPVTIERIEAEYAKIAFADRRMIVDEDGRVLMPNELNDELGACVEGFAVSKGGFEVKMASKMPALRALAERRNYFKEHEQNKAPKFEITIAGKEAEL